MTCYAISEYDKSHYKFSNGGDAVEFLRAAEVPGVRYRLAHADADGWIKHEGNDCPLPPNARADFRLRDGVEASNNPAHVGDWSHSRSSIYHIIAYRPILEDKEQDMSEQEWSGEGLPPVGCVCMLSIGDGEYSEVEVAAHFKGTAMVVSTNDAYTLNGFGERVFTTAESVGPKCLHPIRTAAQRAEDAVSASLRMQLMQSPIDPDAAASALYRAIRDGRIPGVKIDD